MARIRSVHPGLWTDENFVSLSMPARLLAIGIWNECDDQGAFEWKPITLKMRILPADTVDVAALLVELEAADMVRSYQSGTKRYGAVRNFAKFQRPKKPNSVFPMPDQFRIYAGHSGSGSSPDEDDFAPSPPPVPPELPTASPPLPHKPPTNGEKPPQMEDGGGKKEEEGKKEDSDSGDLDSVARVAADTPSQATSQPKPAQRARQLPKDWTPSLADSELAWRLGVDPAELAEEFRDYWLALPGAKALKLDWDATFRNRVKDRARHSGQRVGTARRQRPNDDLLAKYGFGRPQPKDVEVLDMEDV